MTLKTFIDSNYNIAVEIDSEESKLLMYDYRDNEVDYSTEGILTKINSEIGKKIEEHFGIELYNFDVEVYDETLSMAM